MKIISSKHEEEFKATTFVVNILKLHTNPKVLIQEFVWSFEILILNVLDIPYLPVYNAHSYFEACFQKKKSDSTSFLTKNNFLEKFSRNVKSNSTCCFIAVWSKTIYLHNAWNIFMNKESWN